MYVDGGVGKRCGQQTKKCTIQYYNCLMYQEVECVVEQIS